MSLLVLVGICWNAFANFLRCSMLSEFLSVPFFGALFGVRFFSAGSTNGPTQSSFGNEAGAGHETKRGLLDRGIFNGFFFWFLKRLPTSFKIYLFFCFSRLDFHI